MGPGYIGSNTSRPSVVQYEFSTIGIMDYSKLEV